jgi:hypothetical protein
MAAQIHFTVSDALHADVYEVAREYGLSVSQYARLVFLANRFMDGERLRETQIADLDRREEERRERDDARRRGSTNVRRVDGGGWTRGMGER